MDARGSGGGDGCYLRARCALNRRGMHRGDGRGIGERDHPSALDTVL